MDKDNMNKPENAVETNPQTAPSGDKAPRDVMKKSGKKSKKSRMASIFHLKQLRYGSLSIAVSYTHLELRALQRMLSAAGAHISDSGALLLDERGLPPDSARERRMETLFMRQDFARPFALGCPSPEPVVLPEDFFVRRLLDELPDMDMQMCIRDSAY